MPYLLHNISKRFISVPRGRFHPLFFSSSVARLQLHPDYGTTAVSCCIIYSTELGTLGTVVQLLLHCFDNNICRVPCTRFPRVLSVYCCFLCAFKHTVTALSHRLRCCIVVVFDRASTCYLSIFSFSRLNLCRKKKYQLILLRYCIIVSGV